MQTLLDLMYYWAGQTEPKHKVFDLYHAKQFSWTNFNYSGSPEVNCDETKFGLCLFLLQGDNGQAGGGAIQI